MSVIVLAAMMIVFSPAGAFAQERAPKFSDYTARVVPTRRSTKVRIHSTPYTACYRTMLRNVAREGELFAGHYAIDYWGCGTCVRVGIVDLLTGRAYVTPFEASDSLSDGGFKVKADSRLLVIDGYSRSSHYVWNGRDLLELDEGRKLSRRDPDFLKCSEMSRGQETSAPQLELTDLNGRTVRLSDYKGKVVLINFWATWCPPCRAEMPDLIKLQREHGKEGLQVIGITYPPETKTRVRRFAKNLKVNYPIVLGTREIKSRFSSEETLPLTVVINRDGKVSDIISGILLGKEFDEKIKPLLMKNLEGEKRDAKSNH
jgi:thiol-disulfide isomerase/thioredoxin